MEEVLIAGGGHLDFQVALQLGQEVLIGGALGFAGGRGIVWMANRADLPHGLHPIFVVASAVVHAVAATVLQGRRRAVDVCGGSGHLTRTLMSLSSPPPVLADRERLTQIVTNLADNAFTYTNPGGTITMSAYCDSEAVQVSVKDTGIGLSEEEQERIFERFYRGEDPLVLGSAGTGLGLSIVQRLVEMHGGRIWAESAGQGQGSTFHLRLKLAPTTLEN